MVVSFQDTPKSLLYFVVTWNVHSVATQPEELCNCWKRVSKQPYWQHVFVRMLSDGDAEPHTPKADKQKRNEHKDNDQKKKAKVSTPEKGLEAKSKTKSTEKGSVKVVQEAKPAAFGNRPELPLAPMAPGQKAEVNDADANMELMEGEDEEAFKHSILRQRHKRTSQKNPITESMRVEQATKQYLAQIGLTWPLFQKEHRRPKHITKSIL